MHPTIDSPLLWEHLDKGLEDVPRSLLTTRPKR